MQRSDLPHEPAPLADVDCDLLAASIFPVPDRAEEPAATLGWIPAALFGVVAYMLALCYVAEPSRAVDHYVTTLHS